MIMHIRPVFINRQTGAALLVFMVVLVLVFTTYTLTTLKGIGSRQTAENNTTVALARAKEALLAFAVSNTYTNNPGLLGFLPCPHTAAAISEGTSEGNCDSQYVNSMGYLPWRSLKLPPLKDASGQCLWYAVSGDYKNSGTSRSDLHNDDSIGQFQIFNASGNLTQGNIEEDRVVAVVIAPGGALAGQQRNVDPNTLCGGDYTASHFLDVVNGIDNGDISVVADALDDFVAADKANQKNFNDRIITITQNDIFDRIRATPRFNQLMSETTEALARCLATYQPPAAGGGGGLSTQQCIDLNCNTTAYCNSLPPRDRGACHQGIAQCRRNCRNNSGATDNRLPWPAPVTLADYRDSNSYDDTDVSGAGVSKLGRFPMIVDDSDTQTGYPSGGVSNLLDRCTSIVLTASRPAPLPPLTVDLSTGTYRLIWEHWKDHFFYAVSGSFQPSATSPPPADCTAAGGSACITTQQISAGDTYAGIVIFSAERLPAQNQRRLANTPPGVVNPAFIDSKADITNYLEGSNIVPDTNGDGDYQANRINDRAYCIQENMDVVQCF